ncbi:hypothetical protein [Streptomyces sp. NBC_00564]|uniref:hypothetical protein n=1 Tax=Streptomyces sp. NBC_00564 TaxID=2903663 RepID=UPI00352CBF80|nr:hypothetical protein OG256_19675 [Streptomyces sp. NBC_00564]
MEEIVNPQTFKGFNAKVTLYNDRIEITRDLTAKIGGVKGSIVALVDLVQPLSKPPTAWVNGYVYLATNADPAHLSYWADPPKWKIGRQSQLILFNWFQRSNQAAFLAALDTAWRAVRTES